MLSPSSLECLTYLLVIWGNTTMKFALNTLLLTVCQLKAVEALNNGIGLTPHMGWSSWVSGWNL